MWQIYESKITVLNLGADVDEKALPEYRHSDNELLEVSRGHSTKGRKKLGKD